jgi:phosphoribosylaminoimidazole-succinocarboxamide synthase
MGDRVITGTDFNFPGQKNVYHGKVRDVYDLGESLLLVATDRYSAFDRNLAVIAHKGELLTAISQWWFEQTGFITKNHIKSYPDPNVAWCHKYKVIPVEMVVRGYITGVTNTSLWLNYSEGQRDFGDFKLPDGLSKNQKLPTPVLTPTTKFEKQIDKGQEPDNYDKEFLRLWYKSRFDPYKDKDAPKPSFATLNELVNRYTFIYERLSGITFTPDTSKDPLARIKSNVLKALAKAK